MVRTAWACAAMVAALTSFASAEPAKRYEVRVEAEELEVDTRGTVTIEVTPQGGFAIDEKYPARLSFIPDVGDEVLVVARREQGSADARYAPDGSSLRWEVDVMARKAGRHPAKIKAEIRVCKENDCSVGVSELRLAIVAKGS
jgi:hypothetical protein